MRVINLTPEAMELVNQLCDPDTLEEKIVVLEQAEDQLQETAYAYQNDREEGYKLYDVAYTVKTYRKELVKLKKLIENGREETTTDQA